MHILIIEPDTVLAATYAATLEAAGHTVASAQTAQQAVYLADEQCPNVVVLEPQMARHNGIEFLYEFKSYSEWQHIPVVILSVIPVSELEGLAILRTELGVTTILSKSHTKLSTLSTVVIDAAKARL